MANSDKVIVNITENSIQFRLCDRFYSRESVRAAAYKYTDIFFVLMEPDIDEYYIVTLRPKNPASNLDYSAIGSEFMNELLDQQIRIDLANRYDGLRKSIVDCAFRPIHNIGGKND